VATNLALENIDEEIAKVEQELKRLDAEDSGGSIMPSSEKKDSTLMLFRELIVSPDSRKFANLNNDDLKYIRHILNVAAFFDSQNLKPYADYLKTKAENILSTSMSHKGWFGNLIVTQIKKETKVSGMPSEKKGWFFSKPQQGGQDGQV